MGINIRFQALDLMGAVELSLDLGAVAANQTVTQTVSIPGLVPGDLVVPFETANNTGLLYGNGNIVATAGEFDMPAINATGSSINAGEQTFRFLVFRPDGDLGTVVPDV